MGNRPGGGCPDGETCSSVVTQLFFSGASLGDQLSVSSRPRPIAKGGTQRVRVWLDREAAMPFSMLPAFPSGLMGPFCRDPASQAPLAYCAHDGGLDVLSIQPSVPPVVEVVGRNVGLDHLRILANFGAQDRPVELHDRVVLEVVEIDDVRVVTPLDLEFGLLHGDRAREMPVVFAVKSQPPAVIVGLFGESDEGQIVRVVDESLSFSNLPAALTRDPGHWDSLRPSGPFPQTQDHLIGIMGGGGNALGQARLRVVGTVSNLELALGLPGQVVGGESLSAGTTYQVCFSSFFNAGGRDHIVYGAKVSAQPSANTEVSPVTTGGPHVQDSCVMVRPLNPGVATVSVVSDADPDSVGGERQKVFSFNVCASGGCAAATLAEQAARRRDVTRPTPEEAAAGPAPGERARAR